MSKVTDWKRKIANGKRRQADVIMQKKLVAWDKLKAEHDPNYLEFGAVLMPMLRSFTPSRIANDLVSVQPLGGKEED